MKGKNALIRALLWLLNPVETRHKYLHTPQSFLIVSTTGLGDTLWGTPAIRALRKSYPDATIVALTSPIGAEVLQRNPHIDELHVLGSSLPFSLLRLLPKLRRRHFDATLVFHTSQRLILPFCGLLETGRIIGTAGINKDLDFLLTTPIKQRRQHEIERRLDIAREVGAYVTDFHLEMATLPKDKEKVRRLLDSHGIPDHIPLVGIQPGSLKPFKQWPKEHFIEVGRRLCQHLGCQIFVSGDRSEASLVLDIASEIPGGIPLAGELDLMSLTLLFSTLDLLITNDTGPMHLAFAAKTPTVALFGPTDPSLCGPYLSSDKIKILSAPPTCYPCLGKACTRPFCLMQIGPDAVYDAALSTCQSLVVE